MTRKHFETELHYYSDFEGILAGGGLVFVFTLLPILMGIPTNNLPRFILGLVIVNAIPGIVLIFSIRSKMTKKVIILDDRQITIKYNDRIKWAIPYLTINEIFYKKREFLTLPYHLDNVMDIFYTKDNELQCLVLSKRKGLTKDGLDEIRKIIMGYNPNAKLLSSIL